MDWPKFQLELYRQLANSVQHAAVHKYTSKRKTRLLTQIIAGCAQLYGLKFVSECKIVVDDKLGFVDAALFLPESLTPWLCIELDRGNKFWSVTKLIHAANTGSIACWVKWGNPVNPDIRRYAVNNGVNILDLTTNYPSPK